MKRILYTVANGKIGGGQIICLNIMLAAKSAGYEAVLLSETEGPFTDLVRKKGIKIYIAPLKRSFYFHKIPGLIKILKAEKIDFIHSNSLIVGSIMMRIAGLLLKIPVISHMHTRNYFSQKNIFSRVFAKTLDNLTVRACKDIITVSQATKKSLIEQGYPGDRIKIVYNAIDTKTAPSGFDRHALLNKLGIAPGAKILLHIGRLCPDKGQEDLLKAMRFISEKRDDVYCVFAGGEAGEGENFKEKLENMAALYKLSNNVRLLGFRRDIDSLMAISDAVVLPSYYEGLPVTALEAMRNKKPFIGYATDGVPEVIENGKNGYLANKGDVKGLADALISIMENPARAKEMGEEGFRILEEKFNFQKEKDRILELYAL